MAEYPKKKNRTSMKKGWTNSDAVQQEEVEEGRSGNLQREVIRLNLGCGSQKLSGWVNVDQHEEHGPELWTNIDTRKLPYEDASVEEIQAISVLQYIKNLIRLMNDCHRVLKPSGYMKIVVPLFPSTGAFDDPLVQRCFTQRTFEWFIGSSPFWGESGRLAGITPWKRARISVLNGDTLEVLLQK